MQELVSPESLDELDRRVYDLAIQPMPLAEIAVRLGVPVGQADERLQRVFRRLGVSDRAGLRALAAAPAPAVAEEPEFAIGAEPEYVIGEELTERPLKRASRRNVLAAGGVVALSAAVAGGVLRLRAGGDEARKPTGAEPTSVATTLAAVLPIQTDGGLGTRWIRDSWGPGGEAINADAGLFLLDTDLGAVTGYWFNPVTPAQPGEAATRYFNYRTGYGGRLIAASASTGREYLIHRSKDDVSWSWDASELRIIALGGLPDNYLLVEEVSGNSGLGKFHVLTLPPGDRDLKVRTSFELPAKDGLSQGIFRPGGQEVLLWTGERSSPLLYLVHATTGDTKLLLGKPGTASALSGISWFIMPFEVYGDWVRTTWLVRGSDGTAVYLSASFDWDGNVVHDIFHGGFDISFSPDGRRFVREQVERMTPVPDTEGEREFWTNAESGEWGKPPEFRIRSASVHYGDGLPPRRWLADGSGFVSLVRGPSHPSGQVRYQGAIYSSDGSKSTRIPLLHAALEQKRWFESSWNLGPVPSPYDANLIAFGRTTLYDVARNLFRSPNVASPSGPDHIDPWCAGPGLFVFALPHGGHGGASAPLLLPPKVEKPPADEEMRFVVQGTGNGLNLRNGPSTADRVLLTVAEGTELRIAEDKSQPVGRRSSIQAESGAWVYVEAPGKIYGWVFAEYLAWA